MQTHAPPPLSRSVREILTRLSVAALLLCSAAFARAEKIAGLDGVSNSSVFEISAITPLPLEGWTVVEGAARVFDTDGGNGAVIAEEPFAPFIVEYVPETPVPPQPNTRYTLRFDTGFISGSTGGSAEYRFELGTVTGGVFTGLGEPATGVVFCTGNIFSGPVVSGSAEQVFDTGATVSGESLAVRWELVGYDGASDFFGFDNVTLDAAPVPAPDSTPPALVSAGGITGQSVGIRFDEPLDAASAAVAANYTVSGGVTVTSAELRPDGTSVRLEVAGLTSAEFTVTVNGVKDAAGNALSNAQVTGAALNLPGTDIGFPIETGVSFSDTPGVLKITGGGRDVWFEADSFHFASQERTGDFDVRVRVTEFGPANAGADAKALLMARESADPESRHVSVTVYPRGRNWTSYQRVETLGNSSVLGGDWRVAWPDGAGFPNAWLRLKRTGETFTTYGSVDGEVWTQIGDSVTPETPYPQTVSLGLGVTSTGEQFGAVAPLATAGFSDFGDFALNDIVINFTQQPASATVQEQRAAVFTAAVVVTGTAPQNLVYQWLRNGEVISGATGLTYSTPATLEDNGARYQLKVSVSGTEFKLSDEAVLTVTQDTTAPVIESAHSPDGVSISLGFSEVLDPDSALAPSNYTLTGGSVDEVFLMEGGRNVVLRVSGLGGTGFQLSVSGVADLAGNFLNAVPVTGETGPWTIEDIGFPGTPGWTFSDREGAFDVTAAGQDIWGLADAFHFIHRQQTGDFDVQVRLARLDLVSPSTRGGLMARESLEQGSRNLFVGTYPAAGDNHWVSTVRRVTDNETGLPGENYVPRDASFAYPNVWFRLMRAGNTFTAWYGSNGADWTQIGNQYTPDPPMPATIYLGMATTSISSSVPTTAHYRDFSAAATPERPELEIVRDGQGVRISWPESAEGFTLHTTQDLTASAWPAVTGQPSVVNGRWQITLPVENGRRFYRLQK